MKTYSLKNILTVLFVFLCVACSTDYDYDVTFDYTLRCSEDLLQFVTPVITITNADGSTETIKIQDSDWNKTGEVSIQNAIIHVSTKSPGWVWQKNICFGYFGVRSSMEVKYERKEVFPEINESKQYVFFHNLDCSIIAIRERKKCLNTKKDVETSSITNVTNSVSKYGSTAIEQYINELINITDTSGGIVDGDGKITKF